MLPQAILLEGTHEGALLGGGLELSVTHLAGSIDEVKVDLLQGRALGLQDQGFPEDENPVSGTSAGALDHDEVIVDLTIVGETSHGGDGLLCKIVIGGTAVLDQLSVLGLDGGTDTVDFLVDLGTVMVTLLTSTGNRVLDSAGMPSTNTGDLTQTLVGLTGQLLCVPTGGDTCKQKQNPSNI